MPPTLYEWAGGAVALDRLTECFYRRVHDDPILAPVFAGMSPEHPHHVALWLGEGFGGPPVSTEEHGGARPLLRQLPRPRPPPKRRLRPGLSAPPGGTRPPPPWAPPVPPAPSGPPSGGR